MLLRIKEGVLSGAARGAIILCALLSLILSVQAQTPRQGEAAGAIISGRITIGGKPASHVFVTVEPDISNKTDSKLPGTSTDEEGNYRLSGVPEGRFVIKAVAPAYTLAEAPSANRAGTVNYSGHGLDGFILSVARGDTIPGINFEMTRGGVITGRVTDARDKPVVAARVDGRQVHEDGSSTNYGGDSETDDRGVYRIYGLPDGKYVVSVYDGEGGRHFPGTFHPNVTAQANATIVEVSSGHESTGVDISLGQPEKNYSVRGRVIDESTGRPVPNVKLNFTGFTGVAAYREGFFDTDTEGKFEVKGFPSGRYQIHVTFTGAPNQGYYSDPLTFEVVDADVKDVELKATRGATISGAVVIEGSNDPALVGRLSALTAEQVQPPGSEVVGVLPLFVSAAINPNGRFELTGVRPGRTKLNISLPEGFDLVRIERAGIPITDGMDVSLGEQIGGVRVVLAYGTGSIRGQAKVTGGNLPGRFMWRLQIRRVGGERIRYDRLDATGLFWIKDLAPGTYEVTALIDYAEVPGVTPATYPAPIKQMVTVENGVESRVSLSLDLSKSEKN